MDNLTACDHCQEPIYSLVTLDEDGQTKNFCCHGCRTVYSILNANGLNDYYKLKADNKNNTPVYSDKTYLYLDSNEFKKQYIDLKDGEYEFTFFVEGVHCVACLWLLEKLSTFNPEIISSRLDMSKSLVYLRVNEKAKLSEIAKLLDRLGYRPFALLEEDDQKQFEKLENRKDLIRIGVAFACTGNIMLYAISVYTGASDFYKSYFNFFGFLCFLPIIFYCALPFYKTAFSSLKAKTLSVDIPIVVAIFLTFFMGVYSFIASKDYFYFDTLSSLVFLLLLSRYLLKKLQQKSLGSSNLTSMYLNNSALKQNKNGDFEEVLSKYIKVGDIIKINSMEEVPVDGVVIEGKSYLNNSLLTGEVKPVKTIENDQIYMGAKNLSNVLLIKATSSINESRFGQMLKTIESGWNSETTFSALTDRISSRFVVYVFSLAFLFFVYFIYTQNFEVAFSRSLTLLIITCPCALALTTPLAFILGLTSFAKNGIYIKNENVLEKLTQVKSIFFDKTGTLTIGKFDIIDFMVLEKEQSDQFLSLLFSLENQSHHPIAISICKYLEDNNLVKSSINLEQVQEIPGVGVTGFYQGLEYKVQKLKTLDTDFLDSTQVGLYQGETLLIKIILNDSIRPSVKDLLAKLKQDKFKTYILSGDNKQVVESIGLQLGFSQEDLYSEKSPEQKGNALHDKPFSLMVGDGANDALAMQKAFVGVSVRGSAELSLRASDIYLSKNGVEKLASLFEGSLRIINLIKRNLLFSFFYNIIGIYLAFTGQVSPLMAAILMPLSSVTVMVSTLLSIKKLNKVII